MVGREVKLGGGEEFDSILGGATSPQPAQEENSSEYKEVGNNPKEIEKKKSKELKI